MMRKLYIAGREDGARFEGRPRGARHSKIEVRRFNVVKPVDRLYDARLISKGIPAL